MFKVTANLFMSHLIIGNFVERSLSLFFFVFILLVDSACTASNISCYFSTSHFPSAEAPVTITDAVFLLWNWGYILHNLSWGFLPRLRGVGEDMDTCACVSVLTWAID